MYVFATVCRLLSVIVIALAVCYCVKTGLSVEFIYRVEATVIESDSVSESDLVSENMLS
jgi:hypothetical protein